MTDDILQLDGIKKKFALDKSKISTPIINMDLNIDGYNEDITDKYFWHLNFAYYVGKGYTPLKLEDYHYFSENSQFGTQMRQVKGGSIRAFQENMGQLIQLIRSHLIPLLKEVKIAHEFKNWFDQITQNDKIVQKLKSNGVSDSNEKLKIARGDRNEAINHLKDKWVNEVDMGKLWQLNRSATEQGLDFALLPQLFFGTSLDDPLQTKKKLKEQLDEDIYSVDISLQAKEQVARFMYRFYTWLPTAIADTNVTFKLKLSALRNIYAQIQMYINFMKPLLIEINRKAEGFENSNFYKDFEMDNPEFVNMFDYSYSFIKVLGIRNFGKPQRGKNDLKDLEFSRYGLFLGKHEIISGKFEGETGFIVGEDDGKYLFYPSKTQDIDDEEFEKLQLDWQKNKKYINKIDLRTFPIMEKDFSQKRIIEIINTEQGAQQIPYMKNKIDYKGYTWNIYEIASYRENLKVDNLKLLETFIDELKVVREDLLKYINYFPSNDLDSIIIKNKKRQNNSNKDNSDTTFSDLTLGPFRAIGEIGSLFIPKFKSNQKENISVDKKRDNHHLVMKLYIAEDVWKVYTIFKKNSGLIQF